MAAEALELAVDRLLTPFERDPIGGQAEHLADSQPGEPERNGGSVPSWGGLEYRQRLNASWHLIRPVLPIRLVSPSLGPS